MTVLGLRVAVRKRLLKRRRRSEGPSFLEEMDPESTGGAMNTPVERFECSTHVHKLHRGVIGMQSFFSNRRRCFLALFSLLAGFTLAVSAQAQSAATEDLN